MSTKKSIKMDPKLVAEKESHEAEVRYIAKTFKVPITVLRKVMKDAGKDGKPSRSRTKIYAALRILGYIIKTRYIK